MKNTTPSKAHGLKPYLKFDAQNSRNITLSCRAPEAKEVFVAGTFNGWSPTATPLSLRLPEGDWRVVFPATRGRHEFKFVVDGQWCCEPGDHDVPNTTIGSCQNSYGTTNRVFQ